MRESDRIWITWEVQRRNRSMSNALGAKLYIMESNLPRPVKYIVLSTKTTALLFKNKKSLVFVQNPSIVLSFIGVLLSRVLGFRLVVDEHNAGIYPLEGKSTFLNYFAHYIVRHSSLVIVTNDNLKAVCNKWGGDAFVMPDPLPVFSIEAPESEWNSLRRPLRAFFICSWANDEPYNEVFSAFAELPKNRFDLTVTGNYKGKVSPEQWPGIHFTGFLSEYDYEKMLAECDAVIVLTKRENCLNCGAYEAVAMGKPGVLSDTSVLRNLFYKGFLYTDNTKDSIIGCMNQIFKNFKKYKYQVIELKSSLSEDEQVYIKKLNDYLL